MVPGTGWPIVTGQRRASAIVTGRAGYLAGGPLGDPAVDPAAGAEPVTVLGGPLLQPRRIALMPAARAVAAVSLRSMGRSFRRAYFCYTAPRQGVPVGRARCQCAELAMARAAVLPKLPSRRIATCWVPQIKVLPVVRRAEAVAS